jgi:exosome complex component RRP41
MAYKKRYDGRKFDELRPITAKTGVIKEATGSALFKIGNTAAYAAVYGPRELHPKFMQDPTKAVLRVNYSMMPFSGMGDRVRPGPNRRARELSMVIQKALEPVLDLSQFPNAVVDVFIELPETDAGSRCASICAASMALADAGFTMKDLVSAVSIGRVDDKLVVDLDYAEEAHEDGPVADVPIAMIPSTGEITLLQLDGEMSGEMLKEGIAMARTACQVIKEEQMKAIKARYQ